jgi:transcriptional regulator with XRE-family HTH domain
MYITKEQLEERVEKTSVLYKVRERIARKSRERGDKEDRLTHEERTLIGVLEGIDTQKNIAELMNVSSQTVSNNSRALTSPTIGVDKELREDIASKKAAIAESKLESEKQIQEQLVTNLAAALGHVANNLGSTDAVEASKIATDMSKILDRVTASKDGGGKNRTAIIINVPQMKEEKSYQTITV